MAGLGFQPSHSGFLLALLFHKCTENRVQPLVAASEQHHVRDIDGRPPGMPNAVIPISNQLSTPGTGGDETSKICYSWMM
jgi:hypothetical protein